MSTYSLVFVTSFMTAYLIYDSSSYVEPLWQAVILVILIAVIDVINKNYEKKLPVH